MNLVSRLELTTNSIQQRTIPLSCRCPGDIKFGRERKTKEVREIEIKRVREGAHSRAIIPYSTL